MFKLKIYNKRFIPDKILDDIEAIGAEEEMLPIYYKRLDLRSELEVLTDTRVMTIEDRDENVVSFAVYTIVDRSHVHIKSICVRGEYKRNSLGKTMIEQLKSMYDVVTLYVQEINTVAVDFYKKMGFEIAEVDREYYMSLDSKTAYYMECKSF